MERKFKAYALNEGETRVELTAKQIALLEAFLSSEEVKTITDNKTTGQLCIHCKNDIFSIISVYPSINSTRNDKQITTNFLVKIYCFYGVGGIEDVNSSDRIQIYFYDQNGAFTGDIIYEKSLIGMRISDVKEICGNDTLVDSLFKKNYFPEGAVPIRHEQFCLLHQDCGQFLQYVRNRIGELQNLGIVFSDDPLLSNYDPTTPAPTR